MPKSATAVIALLACLAMGAVGVPLDIRTPRLLRSRIVSHIAPKLVLVAGDLADDFRDDGIPSLAVAAGLPAEDFPPCVPHAPDAPALILMSSGSSGPPKAITITHGNLDAFVGWAMDEFRPLAQDRFLSVAPLHFDLAIFDILVSQRAGARLYVLSEKQTAFPAEIIRVARAECITLLYTVPTVLHMMTRLPGAEMPSLRWLLFAGEVMPRETLCALPQIAPHATFANLYGPTETNVVACHRVGTQDFALEAGPLPIGKPCADAHLWIADAAGFPVPTGTQGEICVRGPSVTPGYWNAEKRNKTIRVDGDKNSYRTGDLGWQTACGTFYLAGRLDRQIKLRGNLVNLDEIEAVAMGSGVVTSADAIFHDRGILRAGIELVIVAQRNVGDPEAELRSFLIQHLPKSHLPLRIRIVDNLPQSLNGKLNRRALAEKFRELEP